MVQVKGWWCSFGGGAGEWVGAVHLAVVQVKGLAVASTVV